MQQTGFGDNKAQFCVYLANRPPMPEYQQLDSVLALGPGDIDRIYRHSGNGWRKIFNVYAKLLFALDKELFPYAHQAQSWQEFRDTQLLQHNSNTALLFSQPQLVVTLGDAPVPDVHVSDIAGQHHHNFHIIAGRTHAKQLLAEGLQTELHWLNDEFAIDPKRKLLVTPFFDYRQLNNEKIAYTATLLLLLKQGKTEA